MKSLGGLLSGSPSGVSCAPDRLDVFAAGPGNMVWRWWLQGGTIVGPAPLPLPNNIPAEGLCAVSSGSGRLEVFAAGAGINTPLWWRGNGAAWSAGPTLPLGANLPPVSVAAVAAGPNNIDVFAAGFGNTPNWWHWNGVNWSAPVQLPKVANLRPVRVAVVSRANRLDVFAAGAGNHLWHWWRIAPAVWQWENVGGSLPEEGVSAISWGPGRIDVFAAERLPGGRNPLRHWWWDGSAFSGTEDLGGNLAVGTVSAVSRAPNRLDVFGISWDGRLARWQWDGIRWNGPNYRGGNVLPGDASAVVRAPNRIDVFVRGAGNSLLQWPGGGLENAPRGSWTNWPGTQGPIAVEGHCRPGSIQELITIVNEAEQRGRRVRAVGSSWSGSDIAVTSDYLVETDQLDSIVTEVLNATPSILIPSASNLNLLHVEAGIKLVDLNRFLDERSLAMKTLGGSSGQSLAGALSTSVHGADFDRGPLPDTVRAIHLVGPGGTEYWIEPTAGITDPNRLSTALGIAKANIHYDDNWFNSVLVSMGAMGIIYSLIIEVVPQYNLTATCEHLTWDSARARLAAGTPFVGNRAVQVVVSQFKHNDGTRPSFLTTRFEATKTEPYVGGGLPADLTGILANLLIGVLNVNPFAYPAAVKGALFQALKAEKVDGWAHTIMTAPPPPPARGLGLEFAFDATNDGYLEYVDAALQILDKAYQDERLGLGGWLSLRFVGKSRAYLSPQHHSTRTCMVEFTAATALNSTKPLLARLEAEGKARGGIQHWGMFNDLNESDVRRAYPDLDKWLAVRSVLTKKGTLRTFDNAFSERCGLTRVPISVGGQAIAPRLRVASSTDGTFLLTAVDDNGKTVVRRGNAAPPYWPTGWSHVQSGATQPAGVIGLVSRRPAHFDAFVAGNNEAIYTAASAGNGWGGWWEIPGVRTAPGSSIGAVSRGPDKLDIFLADQQGRIMSAAWEPGFAQWHGWWHINNGTTAPSGDVSCVSRGRDLLDIFTVSTNTQVHTAAWAASPGQWQGWWPISGVAAVPGSPITCVSRSENKLDIFLADSQGRVMSAAWEPGFNQWHGWWHINNGMTAPGATVAAVSRQPDFLDLFVVGTAGQIYTAAWEPTAGWRGWWPIAGVRCRPGTPLAALSPRRDTLLVIASAVDGHLMAAAWDPNSGGWSSWSQIS